MIALALAILGVLACLWAGEALHKLDYHPEVTRKFVHITVASFAATWPFFMSWSNIELMSLLMFLGVVASRHFSYFKSIHRVERPTWGELFFAMGIGMTALMSQSTWTFTAAMLLLGLADGLAAIVGTLIGMDHKYKVFGYTKTRAGTLTFFGVAFLVVLFCVVLRGPHEGVATLIWLPAFATLLENVGVGGTDNLIVPLFIAIIVQ